MLNLVFNNFVIYYITSIFKSKGTVFNLATSKSSAFVSKLSKLTRALSNLLISIYELQLSKQQNLF